MEVQVPVPTYLLYCKTLVYIVVVVRVDYEYSTSTRTSTRTTCTVVCIVQGSLKVTGTYVRTPLLVLLRTVRV